MIFVRLKSRETLMFDGDNFDVSINGGVNIYRDNKQIAYFPVDSLGYVFKENKTWKSFSGGITYVNDKS